MMIRFLLLAFSILFAAPAYWTQKSLGSIPVAPFTLARLDTTIDGQIHDTADTLRQRITDSTGAMRTLLAGKEPTITSGISSQVWLGPKAWGQVADAQVASGAAIAWSKISKSGAVAADVGAAAISPATTIYAGSQVAASNYAVKLATLTITSQYGSAFALIDMTVGDGNTDNAAISAKVRVGIKQQQAMSNTLDYADISFESMLGINANSFLFIKTVDNASIKQCELWFINPTVYASTFWSVPFSGSATFASMTQVPQSSITTALDTYVANANNANYVAKDLYVGDALYSTGNLLANGLLLSNYNSGTAYYGIWPSGVTQNTSNFSFLTKSDNNDTYLNAITAINLQIFNGTSRNNRLTITDAGADVIGALTASGAVTFPDIAGGTGGIVRSTSTGVLGMAVAADFPTLPYLGSSAAAVNSSALGGVGLDYFVQGNGGGAKGHRTTAMGLFDVDLPSGFYDSNIGTDGPQGAVWTHLIHSHHNGGDLWSFDIAAPFAGGTGGSEAYYMRINTGASSYGAWRQLWHDGNLNAGLLPGGPYLPLTGGTLTGALNGTSAAFSGTLVAGGAIRSQIASSSYASFVGDNESSAYHWGIVGADDQIRFVQCAADGAVVSWNQIAAGSLTLSDLAGTGTRIVSVSPTGTLVAASVSSLTRVATLHAASQTLTSTEVVIGSAIAGSTTIPANSLAVGDVIVITTVAPSIVGGGDIQVRTGLNGAAVVGNFSGAGVGDFNVTSEVVITAVGSSGAYSITSEHTLTRSGVLQHGAGYTTGAINTTTTNAFELRGSNNGTGSPILYEAHTTITRR